ncbi:linear amide C-N hydrolase [soil metagenome]
MKKLIILILILLPAISKECTTFFISNENDKVFGRNYDFQIGRGLLIVNKKDLVKESPIDKNNNSLKWISKFGSVTFNQFGNQYPMGGMNETGLVVELMWMDGTEYPESDSRPALNTLLWIQYQLDNCSSVQEIIDTDPIVRISKSSVPIHYLVTDKNGNTAAIEFISGKMVYHTSEKIPFKVLTNDFYSTSVDYLSQFKGFGGEKELENSPTSLNRFVKTCKLIKEYNGKSNAIDYSFKVLNDISQPGSTQWSIVYDINKLKIYFRTKESSKIKNIELNKINFNCSSNSKVFDINSDKKGNIIKKLMDYTASINYELIKYSFSNIDFLKNTSEENIKALSILPDSFYCSQ